MLAAKAAPADRADTLAGALPQHVLALVFSSLDEAADLASLRLACRGFVAPASLAARRLRPSRWLPGLGARFPVAQALDLTQLQDAWQEACLLEDLRNLHCLTTLRLGRRTPLTPAGAACIGGLRRLQSLDLSETGLTDGGLRALARAGSLPASLTSLALRESAALTDRGLEALSSFSRLSSLDLSLCSRVTDKALARLARLPALSSLDLGSCEAVGEAGLLALAAAPTLRTLLLPGCWQLGDAALGAIAAAAPQLEVLCLCESGEAAGDAGLRRLAALTRLTALDLGYAAWEQTPAGLLDLLPALPALRVLSVAGAEGASDAVLAAAASALKSLTRLDASECQRVTAAGVAALSSLPALAELSLGWNQRLNDTALEPFLAGPAGAALTKLELSYCVEMGDGALRVLGALPALRCAILRKCTRLTDAGLAALAGAGTAASAAQLSSSSAAAAAAGASPRCRGLLPRGGGGLQLRSLEISHCFGVTAEGLRHLAALPALESLVLAACPRAVTVMGVQALGRCPRLASLDLSDNHHRLDDACMQALSFFPALQSLSVRGCVKVTDHGVAALARLLTLTALRIDLCLQVTPGAVDRLRRALPRLRAVQAPAPPAPPGSPTSLPWPAMLVS